MALINSISGIRGTIGGKTEDNLSPLNVVKFSSAYAEFIKNSGELVVIGRDARKSGKIISDLVIATLLSAGLNVLDIGLATTPTVEIAVIKNKAAGGIIVSASHNPKNWNALKLLNNKGEFLSSADGLSISKLFNKNDIIFTEIDNLGSLKIDDTWTDEHINLILGLPIVDQEAIKKANLRVVVDGINSVGGIAVPKLLEALGVVEIDKLNCEPTGEFNHDAEPLAKNLTEICAIVRDKKADIGFAVDPDVDRLAVIDEKGELFSEEYTLAVASDYILQNKKGNTVSNLSSSQVLRDVTADAGGQYFASAVGEINVVNKMKEVDAVIGGEGNGGVIYPDLHYGRDALVGIALILTYLAKSGKTYSELLKSYPKYYITKNKIELSYIADINEILKIIKNRYNDKKIITIDGIKIDFGKEWIHIRKSNTEPIIRIYTESASKERAEYLSREVINEIKKYII